MTSNQDNPEAKKMAPLSSLNRIVGDRVFVPDAVANSRMAICRKCEFLTSADFCKKCKCMMKLKTRIAVVKCPIDKWLRYSPPPSRGNK